MPTDDTNQNTIENLCLDSTEVSDLAWYQTNFIICDSPTVFTYNSQTGFIAENTNQCIPNIVDINAPEFPYDKEQEQIELIYEFDDGFKIVSLKNNHALWREGSEMHHCVGRYIHRVTIARECLIYSLRDQYNNPQVTFELIPTSPGKYTLAQVKSKRNNSVPKKLLPYVHQYIFNNIFQFDVLRDLGSMELVYTTQGLFRYGESPPGSQLMCSNEIDISFIIDLLPTTSNNTSISNIERIQLENKEYVSTKIKKIVDNNIHITAGTPLYNGSNIIINTNGYIDTFITAAFVP
jgi:hypothetical protein